jgi:outer membrane lipoprotein-sorting protein
MIEFSSRMHLSAVAMLCIWAALWGCAHGPGGTVQTDPAAERMVARLKAANAGLTRFKCLGKMTLAVSGQPTRSFRAAMAGALSDRLRIDMIAPFGGSAGTFSSDGEHLFFVRHPSGEYYKKRYGSGSLRRLLEIDVSVDDLLELMVGRIPMEENRSAKLVPGGEGAPAGLLLLDGKGRTRQRISVDARNTPIRSQWFDSRQRTTHTLALNGSQVVDGYDLPRRIDLTGGNGERVTLVLERYEANAPLDDQLFAPTRPPS